MNHQDPTQMMHFMLIFMALYVFILAIGLIAVIVPSWFICRKAGFSPWLSFLNLIFPIGTLVLLYVLAFGDWKVIPVPLPYWQPNPPPPYPPAPAAPNMPPHV